MIGTAPIHEKEDSKQNPFTDHFWYVDNVIFANQIDSSAGYQFSLHGDFYNSAELHKQVIY